MYTVQPPRKLVHEDPVLESRLAKELDLLCTRLTRIKATGIRLLIREGKLIWDNLGSYLKARGETTTIKPSKWGDERTLMIARKMGCDKSTIQNRYQLYLMSQDYGVKPGLKADHYLRLYSHWLNDRQKMMSANDTLDEASKNGWSAKKTYETVCQQFGVVPKASTTPTDDELKRIAAMVGKSLGEAIRGFKTLSDHPDAADLIGDTHTEEAITLLGLLKRIYEKSETGGAKLLRQQAAEFRLVEPTLGMERVRYVGSKKDQTDTTLQELARHVDFAGIGKAADVFAGRSHMAHAMKQHGWAVTANDKLMWGWLWAKWCVEANKPPISEERVVSLLKPCKGKKPTFITDNFVRKHRGTLPKLTRENALVAENFLANVSTLPDSEQDMARGLLAAVVADQIPFAKEEHGDPVSLQYDLAERIVQRYRDYATYPMKGKGMACNMDAVDFVKSWKGDLIFMDPPYALPRNLYDSQLPESIARGEFVPLEFFDNDYMHKEKAENALTELFRACDTAAPVWIFAYNSSSDLTPFDLGYLLCNWRATVFFAVSHRMGIGTTSPEATKTKEIVVVCVPYPEGIVDNRILSNVRWAAGKTLDGTTWCLPGAFTDPLRPRWLIAADGQRRTVEILDDIPYCREWAEVLSTGKTMTELYPDVARELQKMMKAREGKK